MRRAWWLLLGVAALPAAGMAACGDDEGSGGTGGSPATSQGGGGSDGGNGGDGGFGGTCENLLPSLAVAPATLSATGLYEDIAAGTIASYALEFEPKYPLWSDDADKRRWVYLPECGKVDSSNMDVWALPDGTTFWKEFVRDGQRIETRMLQITNQTASGVLYAAYKWNEDDTEATLLDEGEDDVKGTEHDIPAVELCNRCHGPAEAKGGFPTRALGFGAIQLSHDGPGLTIDDLSDGGYLTVPAQAGGYPIPGAPVVADALGYLHANCGNCHNDTPDSLIFPLPQLRMRVNVADATPEDTGVYTTVVDVGRGNFFDGCSIRVDSGNPCNSCVWVRMSQRGSDGLPNNNQMPPIASDEVDSEGLATIQAWIESLGAGGSSCGDGGAGGGGGAGGAGGAGGQGGT